MGKVRYDHPSSTFPYKIRQRLNVLSRPREIEDTSEPLPRFTSRGIRKSALRGRATDRVNDAAYPYLWRLFILKRMYKNKFSQERLQKIDGLIEATNATIYSKLANCAIDLKKQDSSKKKRPWSESEWKKHNEYFSNLAFPRRDFRPPPVDRGERKPLSELLPRIYGLTIMPDSKKYRRLSAESWYRDPIKVQRGALSYQISDRVRELAKPKEQHAE